MFCNSTRSWILRALTALVFSLSASAQNNPPGSLLIVPEFDNRAGVANIITVTNTNSNSSSGTVDVEFVYIGRLLSGGVEVPCSEFNRTERLTPNDTLTVLTKFHNPELVQGYAYLFAKDPDTGEPVAFDHLIASSLKVDTVYLLDYGVNAATFRAGAGLDDFDLTDLDQDGIRDLNGLEYEGVADEIFIPRFFGQQFFNVARLHLIALSGGADFETTVDLLIYNDNEEQFSSEYRFECWDAVELLNVSGVFHNNFLLDMTNNDPNEVFGFRGLETGWFRIDGDVANSSATSITDPAFFAFLSEGLETLRVADLPFTSTARQTNGDLLPRGVQGDTDNE